MTEAVKFVPRQTVEPHGGKQSPFDMRIVSSNAERRDVYALRMSAYKEFMTPPPPAEQSEFRDAFDDYPTTLQIGAYDEDRLVGAMRLCFSRPFDSLATLPCAAHYPDLQAIKRAANGSLMEVSRFSIDPGISNTSYRTTLYASLVRASLMTAEAANAAKILIATRPDSVRFYKYMLGFEMIGEPALYPPGDVKIALLGGSLAQAKTRQRLQNAFFKITPDEIVSLRRTLRPILERVEAA
ncbi:MAG: GNAT family N-acyltransferase [Hyphomicrobium sp.]